MLRPGYGKTVPGMLPVEEAGPNCLLSPTDAAREIWGFATFAAYGVIAFILGDLYRRFRQDGCK